MCETLAGIQIAISAEVGMKRSTKKILTTHTGSLPRPDSLLVLLTAKEAGQLTDRAAFESSVRSAVVETVH